MEYNHRILELAKQIHDSRMGVGAPCQECIDMAIAQLGMKNVQETHSSSASDAKVTKLYSGKAE